MPKVSVIIPVYNGEKTLDRCIKSIQAQTLTDWEAICVDDGSPDNCGKMLDEYAKFDPRIKPLHKENGGVASARQAGIEAATGDYAIHCDPDDWIEADMLESLVTEAERSGADMVICDYYTEQNGRTKYVEQRPAEMTARAVEIGLFQQLHGSCCNKLISSAYYKRESFAPDLDLMEDLLYTCKILRQNPKIAYVQHAFYHYVLSAEGSITTSFSSNRYWQVVKIFNHLINLYHTEPYIHNLICKHRTITISYVGAMSKGISSKEVRNELDNALSVIWKSNASMAGKVLMSLPHLGLKINPQFLIYMRSYFFRMK